METITLCVFTVDELSDEAKEQARRWYKHGREYSWCAESRESIETFCNFFGVTINNWRVDAWNYDFSATAKNSNFRGLKIKNFTRDNMPTGYCLDCDLWQTFYDTFKKTGNAKRAFEAAVHAGFKAWRDDMRFQDSDENIDEELTINGWRFLANGRPSPA